MLLEPVIQLGYFVNTAKRIITHKIDRPNTQCKLMTRMRKTYFQLTALRRKCLNKGGKHSNRNEAKQARAKKQDDRKNKKRSRRGLCSIGTFLKICKLFKFGNQTSNFDLDDSEIAEDESLSEVVNSSAQSELLSIYDAMNGEVTEEKLQEAIKRLLVIKSQILANEKKTLKN